VSLEKWEYIKDCIIPKCSVMVMSPLGTEVSLNVEFCKAAPANSRMEAATAICAYKNCSVLGRLMCVLEC
jgi:hypothetical protein